MGETIEKRGGHAAKLNHDPDWDLQVSEAERRWKDGQSNEQIAHALADRYPAKTASAISVWTRNFQKKISAEMQTAGFRAYKDHMNR
jgi:predicted flavoprotein YhiN